MKTYTVNVVRIGYGFGQITVNADSVKEARKLALEKAGNYIYNEKSAEYKTDYVKEIKLP